VKNQWQAWFASTCKLDLDAAGILALTDSSMVKSRTVVEMSRAFMHRLFTLMAGIGARPNEDDDSRLRRMVFIWASLAGVPSLVIYCAVFIFLGAPLAAVIMFAYLAIVLIDLIAFGMTGRGFSLFLLFLTLSPLIASLLLVIIFGGLMASAMHVVWGLLTPLGVLVVYGPKTARRYFVAYAVCLDSAYSYRTTPLSLSMSWIRAESPL
jgi:hypothetical protein